MKRSFDSRTAAILFISVIVISGGLFGLHTLQAGRNAVLFLDTARTEVKEEKFAEAIKSYRSYLRLKPTDAAAHAELGKLLFDTGNMPAAYAVLEQALLLNSNDAESRRRAAEAAVALRRHSDARQHVLRLFGVSTDSDLFPDGKEKERAFEESDAELFDWLAQAEQGIGSLEEAERAYQKSKTLSPHRVDCYYRLANLYQRELELPGRALATLGELVENNPDSAEAHLIVAQYHLLLASEAERRGDAESSKKELALAADSAKTAYNDGKSISDTGNSEDANSSGLTPEQITALALLAECKLRLGDVEEAKTYAEAGREHAPTLAQWYTILANVESASGRRDEALKHLRDGEKVVTEGLEQLLGHYANMLLERAAGVDDSSDAITDVENIIERLRSLGATRTRGLVSYLRGRVFFAKEEWRQASQTLENVRPEFDGNPSVQKQIDFWLGQCYVQMGKDDLQLNAFRRAASLDPLWMPARMAVVNSLSQLGRTDEAARELEEVMQLPQAPLEGWLDLARLSIARSYRAGSSADWTRTENLLVEIEKRAPDLHAAKVLQAEFLLAQEKNDDAKQVLRTARENAPDNIETWLSELRLYRRLQDVEQYDDVFAEASTQFGDVPALRLERAVHVLQQSGADAPGDVIQEFRRLAQPAKTFTPRQRQLIWYALAQYSIALKEFDFAEELLAKVSKEDPNNLRLLLVRFDVALQKRDPSSMPQLLADIGKIEGEDALWHYGKAIHLRLLAGDDDTAELQQALAHIEQAKPLRPRWDRLPLLSGEIHMALKDEEASMASFIEAIDLGVREPTIMKSAIMYLNQKGDLKEAGRLVQLLDDQQMLASGDTELARLASGVSLQINNNQRALDIARNAAKASKGYDDYLWLAQLTMVQGPLNVSDQVAAVEERDRLSEEAEKALRDAIAIDPTRPQAWVSLVQLLSLAERADEAKQLVQEAEGKVDPELWPLSLARCYVAMNDIERAKEQYTALLKASPNDSQIVRTVADFHLRTLRRGGQTAGQASPSPEEAKQIAESARQTTKLVEELLTHLLTLEDATQNDREFAQRNLATLSLSRGDYNGLNAALEMTQKTLDENPDDIPSLRLRALALSLQNSPKRRQEAIGLYERLLKQSGANAAPEDRFAMATLYQQNDDLEAAGQQLQLLVGQTANPDLESHRNHALYLSRYIAVLLRLNDLRAADEWLSRLESLKRPELGPGIHLLQVELASRRGDHSEAIRQLLDYKPSAAAPLVVGPVTQEESAQAKTGPSAAEKAAQLEYLATIQELKAVDETLPAALKARELEVAKKNLASDKKQYRDAAEKILREHADDGPREKLQYAAFLVRNQRQSEALDLVEMAAQTLNTVDDLPVMSEAMFMVLESDEPSVEHVVRVQRILDSLRLQHAESPVLLMVLARVLDLQKDAKGAQDVYRMVIKAQPTNVVAMNNLALMLLADASNLTEAGSLSDRTIAEAGRAPTLLDTRAMIAIAAGENSRALELLNEAIDQSADSNYLFHRAVVYQRMGQDALAAEDFSRVDDRQLRANRLIPLEQRWLVELRRLVPKGA